MEHAEMSAEPGPDSTPPIGVLGFLGVGSLLVLEMWISVSGMFFASSLMWWRGWGDVPPDPAAGWKTALIGGLLFFVSLGWLLHGIFRPRVTMSEVPRGGEILLRVPYLTSHPWYVLLDLLVLGTFFAGTLSDFPQLHDYDPTGSAQEVTRWGVRTVGALSAMPLVALCRLVAWFPLRRRVDPALSRRAWVPVAIIWGMVLGTFAVWLVAPSPMPESWRVAMPVGLALVLVGVSVAIVVRMSRSG